MRNSRAFRPALRTLLLAAMLPAIAQAHPGHDGHELTWDLGHLVAYPIATLACFLVCGGIAWTAARILRLRFQRDQPARTKVRR